MVLQRAGATIGAATGARLSLVGAGFGVVQDGTEVEPVVTTQVVVPDSSEAALAAGSEVAAVLGLPATAVSVASAPDAVVDVRVVLGPDVALPVP